MGLKKYFFIRHATAVPKLPSNDDWDDFKRELTNKGIEEARLIAKVTQHLLSDVKVFYTSPLFRAVQTAEIFHEAHPQADFELMISLDKELPPEDFLDELKALECDCCAFVGHGPGMPEFIKRLSGNGNFELAKAGIVLLECDEEKKYRMTFLGGPGNF